jgi:hypothetical protein
MFQHPKCKNCGLSHPLGKCSGGENEPSSDNIKVITVITPSLAEVKAAHNEYMKLLMRERRAAEKALNQKP